MELESAETFLARAPHAVDVISLRRLAQGIAWLRRVAREDEQPPFALCELDDGAVPILVHNHTIADRNLVAAIVCRYAGWIADESHRPGLAVFFPGMYRPEGHAVQDAATELVGPLRERDMRVWAAGPGVCDFTRVGKRGAPTPLLVVTRD